jgi:DNA polymerase
MGFSDLPMPSMDAQDASAPQGRSEFTQLIGDWFGHGQVGLAHGQGPDRADLMIIGAAPKQSELRSVHLFEGPCAELLTAMIEKGMKRSRASVFVAQVLAVESENSEQSASPCMPFWKAQIEAINPKVLMLLGASVLKSFRADLPGVDSSARGQWIEAFGRPALPTFHPSFLLRQPQAKREAWNDLKMVMERLGWS